MGGHFGAVPVALYGAVLLLAGVAYSILARLLIGLHGPDSALAKAIGGDFKGNASVLIYAAAIASAFVQPKVSCALYVLVAILWLVPDPRIERELRRPGE